MNRTPDDSQRRRLLADASSGLPTRVPVVLYSCVYDGRDPEAVMAALRMHAEARDWVVHSSLYDLTDVTSTRTDRKSWPQVDRLLTSKEVGGLVAPCEDEIAFYTPGKERLREWLLRLPAFAAYFPEPVGQTRFERAGGVAQ